VALDGLADRLRDDVATTDVELLVLHGSRARGDATPASDWDLAYVDDPNLDVIGLTLAITAALGSDLVDLVDLATASALLRYRAGRDGIALIERTPEAFLDFRLEATFFWCDVEPVVRAAHRDVLAALRSASGLEGP
jgi:predicted nucleotidyltransferase